MYGGIIYRSGEVVSFDGDHNGKKLQLKTDVHSIVALGDSVGVNGVCLTVTAIDGDIVSFDVWPETLYRTTLNTLQKNESVHVDLPLKQGEFIGGHSVLGHVDFVAELVEDTRVQDSSQVKLWFNVPKKYESLIPVRGCVAVDGVSLTVTDKRPGAFSVSLIPETLDRTHLDNMDLKDPVNIEVDYTSRSVVDSDGILSLQVPEENRAEWQSDTYSWSLETMRKGGLVLIHGEDKGEYQVMLTGAAEKMTEEVITFAQGVARSPMLVTCSHHRAESMVIPAPIINCKHVDEEGRRYLLAINHPENNPEDYSAKALLKTISLFSTHDLGPESWATPGNLRGLQVYPDVIDPQYYGVPEATVHLARQAGLADSAIGLAVLAANGKRLTKEQAEAFSERFQLPLLDSKEVISKVE